MHFHIDQAPRIAGFTMEIIPTGQRGRAVVKEFVTSDEERFHRYVHQIASMFLGRVDWSRVEQFLVLVHPDGSADVHVNAFDYSLEVLAKEDLAAGEPVGQRKVADIRRLVFPSLPVAPADSFFFCVRVGWRFGLFFDLRLGQDGPVDPDETARWLGWGYKQLAFREELAAIAAKPLYERMRADGWFPFIGLLGGDYEDLARLYEGRGDVPDHDLDVWVERRFTDERIRQMCARWWKKSAFSAKQPLIEAGIEQVLRRTPTDTIGAIKTLYSELEGLLRVGYRATKGTKTTELVGKVKTDGKAKFDAIEPLGFPKLFSSYLSKVVFAGFDPAEEVDLTRDSALHGVASVEKYTRYRAVQLLLILDQLHFLMADPPPSDAAGADEGA